MKVLVACAVSMLAVMANNAALAAVIYQTGFEQPDFQLGPVDGQNNWAWEGNIEAGVAHTGSQALYVDGRNAVWQTPAYPVNLTATGIYTISTSYLRTGNNNEVGGLAVNGNTGFIAQIQSNGAGRYYLGNTNSATARSYFTAGVWHDLKLVLDFNKYIMTGSVDGIRLGKLSINNTVKPSSVNYVYFPVMDHNASTRHDAYIDDFSVSRIAAVPEPSNWAMMVAGFGLVGSMMRRRRKACVTYA